MQFERMVAVVTGGSSGIGAQMAKTLSAAGAIVAILDLQPPLVEDKNVRFYQTDVSDQTGILELNLKEISQNLGPIGVLVQCAGILSAKRILGKNGPMVLSDFYNVLETNLVGTFNVMRLVAHLMCQNTPNAQGERGVIINTASIAAFEGQIGQVAYSAAKGGIVSMTLPAAREFAAHGIRVMAIAPGLIDTPMLQKVSAEVRFALESMIPFPPRLGLPEEYASLAMEIIRNPLLNGAVIRLDGALRMGPV